MQHPNEDFLKNFLNVGVPEKKVEFQRKLYENNQLSFQPQLNQQKAEILSKALDKIFYRLKPPVVESTKQVEVNDKHKKLTNYLADQQTKARKHRLDEYLQKQNQLSSSSELASRASHVLSRFDLNEEKIDKNSWLTKQTPFGIFYYNTKTKNWMNTFGKIVDNFNDFFDYDDFESVDGAPNSSALTATKVSYFSDDGSYLALYDGSANQIDIYSVSYTPDISTTFESSVTLGSIPFTGADSQKCLLSNDGNYVIISCPDVQNVYFIDASSDVLLQTINDTQVGFGSVIAADKDFYGLVITSLELNRDPTIYDVRATSWDASTKINYYKRNYKSFGPQKFKKIFSTNAHAQMRKSGIDAETIIAFAPGGFPQSGYGTLQLETSQSTDAGIYRVADLQSKGYQFGLSSLALKTDQINYKAPFLNIDSPRYNFISDPGFTYNSSVLAISRQGTITVANQPNIDLGFDPLPTDAQCESVFKILTLPSVKQFSISRKINGVPVDDKSYYSMASKAPVVWGENIPQTFLDNPSGLTYFNQNIVGSYAEKTYIRGLLELRLATIETSSTSNNSNPVIDEQVLNTKLAINDTHTYHTSQILTSNSIKNIRIYRTLNTSTDGLKTYNYQDYGITGTTSGSNPTPSFETVGMVKILFASSDQTNLENSFFNNATVATNIKQRVGPLATKPFLSNPANCSDAEFALTVNSSVLDDTLVNAFCSNSLLFLNFATQTLVFDIDTMQSYIPVKYRATLTSLSSYKFTYNANGVFLGLQNQIYKFNTSTNEIDLEYSIG